MSRWADLTGNDNAGDPDAAGSPGAAGPADDHGARYAARFADLAASGADVHGEARFCAGLVAPGARVLDAGCGTGRVAAWLAEHGYTCVGADLDEAMLVEAHRAAPEVTWVQADLAALDLPSLGVPAAFDLIVAAGNVIPLLAPDTEPTAVHRLAGHLRPGGYLVAGFGLDAEHLPLDKPPVDLAGYDAWAEAAGLVPHARFATWDGDEYRGGGYAISVHRAPETPAADTR